MSLRVRIALSLALLAGASAGLASFAAYVSAQRQLSSGIDDTLVTRATAAVGQRGGPRARPATGGFDNLGPGRPRCPDVVDQQTMRAVQLIVDGDVVACTRGGAAVVPSRRQLALADGSDGASRTRTTAAGLAYRIDTMDVGGDEARVITMAFPRGGAIQLARDTGESRQVLDGLRLRLAAIAAAATAGAAAVGVVIATGIVGPIRRLTAAAQQIATTRDLSTGIPAGGRDEIGSLAASITTMVQSLAESRDQQQRLVSDASHELRTPLTSLRTNLELLARADDRGDDALSAADRRDILADLEFETAELTALLTELVELATDQSGAVEPIEPVRLDLVCETVAARARRRTGRAITVVGPDGSAADATTVPARPHMIERAVSNLVDNALKYSADATPVTVTVAGGAVRVSNLGPGIAAEDLPRIFDRFYRAADARTEPGSGLGLAIVAQVVGAHHGRVVAANHAHGVEVGFDLPVGPAEAADLS